MGVWNKVGWDAEGCQCVCTSFTKAPLFVDSFSSVGLWIRVGWDAEVRSPLVALIRRFMVTVGGTSEYIT